MRAPIRGLYYCATCQLIHLDSIIAAFDAVRKVRHSFPNKMSASETTPLLPPSPSLSPSSSSIDKGKNNRFVFYVCLITLFIINGGGSMSVPPTTSILQDLLCERHYAQRGLTRPGTDEIDCKIEPVQSSLSMLRGVVGLLALLPGLLLGVPYAALAENWGIKRVLLLSVTGIILCDVWFNLVCWFGRNLPLQLIYLTPLGYLVGGGPSVGGSLLYVLVADYSPAELRLVPLLQRRSSF